MRRLPPLNAVRAFECVARHGSLTKAAAEMSVTHGALSRQVALLEDWLGRPLFIRTPSSALVPTETGRRFGAELTGLLDRLSALAAAAQESGATEIVVTAAPTFTMHWLIPRMSRFQRMYPEVTIKLATSAQPAQLHGGGSEVVIHSVRTEQDRVSCVPFMDDHYIPICHVDLLEGAGQPDVRWLLRQTLLTYAPWPESWSLWSDAAQFGQLKGARVQQFEQMFLARQAALEGMGVAVLPVAVVLDDLVQGKLAAPFAMRGARHRPWLACHLNTDGVNPLVSRFLDWLQAEAADFEKAARACLEGPAAAAP